MYMRTKLKFFFWELLITIACGWIAFMCFSVGNPLGLFPAFAGLGTFSAMGELLNVRTIPVD